MLQSPTKQHCEVLSDLCILLKPCLHVMCLKILERILPAHPGYHKPSKPGIHPGTVVDNSHLASVEIRFQIPRKIEKHIQDMVLQVNNPIFVRQKV